MFLEPNIATVVAAIKIASVVACVVAGIERRTWKYVHDCDVVLTACCNCIAICSQSALPPKF